MATVPALTNASSPTNISAADSIVGYENAKPNQTTGRIPSRGVPGNDRQNLIRNGSFDLGLLEDWGRPVSDVALANASTTPALPGGAPALNGVRLTRTNTESSLTHQSNFTEGTGIEAQSGDQFRAEFWMYSSIASPPSADIVRRNLDGTVGGIPATLSPASVPANTWTKVAVVASPLTAPGRVFLRLINRVNNSTVFITSVRWLRMNAGDLLAPKSVQQDALADTATIRSSGAALPFLLSRAERDADGLFSIMNWIPANLRSDIRSNASTTIDHAPWIQSALNSGESISFPPGTYNFYNGVVQRAVGQIMRGQTSRLSTIFKVPFNFNLSAPCVLGMEDYGELSNVTFFAEQPLGSADQPNGGLVVWDNAAAGNDWARRPANGIVKYPYLIDTTSCTRGRFDNITMSQGWDGINASGNAGGCNLGRIEDGTLNCGIRVDNPLDFYTIETWESWVYNYGGTGLERWSYENPGFISFERADGLSVNSINMWKKRIQYDNASELSATFGIIKLDGGNASFRAISGRCLIGSFNALTDGGPVPFENVGAEVSIGTVDIRQAQATAGINLPLIFCNGGDTTISGGYVYSISGNPAVILGSAALDMTNVKFKGNGTYATPNGVVRQNGGRLGMTRCRNADATAGASPGAFIYLSVNEHHAIVENFFGGKTFRRPQAPIGAIGLNSGILSESTF